MWCPTKDLVYYIRNKYIGKDKVLDGVKFLERVLDKKSSYKRDLSLIKNQLVNSHRREILGTLSDRVPINKINTSFSDYLTYIANNERPYIFVLKDKEILDNFPKVKEGAHPSIYLNKKSSYRLSDFFKNKKNNKNVIYGIIALLLIGLFLYLSCDTNSKSKKDNNQQAIIPSTPNNSYVSPLEQITSRKNNDAKLWGIWLTNFKEIEGAIRLKESYSVYRDIEIMKLDDETFHLFIFAESKNEAKLKQDENVKKRWKHSLIIPIDKCSPKFFKERNYWECF